MNNEILNAKSNPRLLYRKKGIKTPENPKPQHLASEVSKPREAKLSSLAPISS